MNDLVTLDKAISGFDRIDLLSAIAALQLLPENAERIVRLEALAYRVACGQSNRSRKVAPHSLGQLCNSPALGTIAHAEDPFDSVFCEEISFHGGSYRVLPGINEHATFILKRILESLFFHRDDFPDQEYVRVAARVIRGTLALSERICAAAGITRNPPIESRFQEDIVIPNGRVLTRLKSAVRFSRAGFDLLLRNLGLPVGCLQPLTANTEELQPEVDLQISGLLSRKPIIAAGTDVVVASPTELLPALRNALIALAQDRGVADGISAPAFPERRVNGSVLLAAEGAVIPATQGIRSYFSLLPFAYSIRGPIKDVCSGIHRLLKRSIWMKYPLSDHLITIFDGPNLDQWIPLYDPTERLGGVQVYPLVAGVRLLHINIWQFWRGMHPPFFPTPHLLIKDGLITHDENGWYYEAAGHRLFEGHDWRIGSLERTYDAEYDLTGQYALCDPEWLNSYLEQADLRLAYALRVSVKQRNREYEDAKEFHSCWLLNLGSVVT